MNRSEKHYRFAVIADVHIDLENGGKNIYFIHAEENFARALEVIREHHCAFVVNAGDTATNASGAVEEWRRCSEIIESSGYRGPIFHAMGNHEMRFAKYGGCTLDECRNEFIRFTGLAEMPVLRPGDTTYYAYIDEVFGDAFLFLSLENGYDVNALDNFSDGQMDWAEELTERFHREGRRIFLIQHAPIYGFGAGDDPYSPAYEGSMRLTAPDGKPYQNNRRFFELISWYRDIIWLSGHTHVDFRDQLNFTDSKEACRMLHIPALAGTTRVRAADDRNVLDRTFYGDAVQGYIAEVKESSVTFRGIDFAENRFLPEYAYTIYR